MNPKAQINNLNNKAYTKLFSLFKNCIQQNFEFFIELAILTFANFDLAKLIENDVISLI